MRKLILIISMILFIFLATVINSRAFSQNYPVINTGEDQCFDTLQVIPFPQPGDPFFGQDAQYQGIQFSYQDNGDGAVADLNTGLMWQKYLLDNKLTYDQARAAADTFSLAGYNDWRLPSIKELYSLINFNGVTGTSANESTPYIDTSYFEFRYGDETIGERFIDAQYVSSTEYVGTTMGGDFTVFGVNFADGRIKGYGTIMPWGAEKTFEVRFVRGDTTYGINNFVDNTNGAISDLATGLMWSKSDCGVGLNWQEALAWVHQKNQENYLGYNDWRLPDAKELHSIVDYSRSLQTTNSAAIDPVFNVTAIIDEGGGTNYPSYWTNTTHADGPPDHRYTKAVYLAFGEALGFMEIPPNSGNYILYDVHGAGAQRSDPKSGDPNNYPHGFGPQGDVIRIYNYVRCVRGGDVTTVGMNDNDTQSAPSEYALMQNYPNPFNPMTTIRYYLPQADNVRLTIYNLAGQLIKILVNEKQSTGSYDVQWNGRNEEGMHVSSGLYLYSLKAGSFTQTKKLILMN